MKTKKDLVEFINKFGESVRHELIRTTSERLADKLISEGFVQVKEPREFWIVYDCRYETISIFKTKEEAKSNSHNMGALDSEIIHVREVIE